MGGEIGVFGGEIGIELEWEGRGNIGGLSYTKLIVVYRICRV